VTWCGVSDHNNFPLIIRGSYSRWASGATAFRWVRSAAQFDGTATARAHGYGDALLVEETPGPRSSPKRGETLAILADARALMLRLPERHQHRPFWQYAAELLIAAAAERGNRASIDDAAAQLSRALNAEGLL
jgi:hypothetical protein